MTFSRCRRPRAACTGVQRKHSLKWQPVGAKEVDDAASKTPGCGDATWVAGSLYTYELPASTESDTCLRSKSTEVMGTNSIGSNGVAKCRKGRSQTAYVKNNYAQHKDQASRRWQVTARYKLTMAKSSLRERGFMLSLVSAQGDVFEIKTSVLQPYSLLIRDVMKTDPGQHIPLPGVDSDTLKLLISCCWRFAVEDARRPMPGAHVPDRWSFTTQTSQCPCINQVRTPERPSWMPDDIDEQRLSRLVRAGDILSIAWLVDGAAMMLAIRLGEGACGGPPFPSIPRAVLALLLESPSRLAISMRYFATCVDLEHACVTLAQQALVSNGPVPVAKILRDCKMLGSHEAASAMDSLLEFSILMKDLKIPGADKFAEVASRARAASLVGLGADTTASPQWCVAIRLLAGCNAEKLADMLKGNHGEHFSFIRTETGVSATVNISSDSWGISSLQIILDPHDRAERANFDYAKDLIGDLVHELLLNSRSDTASLEWFSQRDWQQKENMEQEYTARKQRNRNLGFVLAFVSSEGDVFETKADHVAPHSQLIRDLMDENAGEEIPLPGVSSSTLGDLLGCFWRFTLDETHSLSQPYRFDERTVAPRWRFALEAGHTARSQPSVSSLEDSPNWLPKEPRLETLAELCWAGKILGVNWLECGAAVALARKIGEDGCREFLFSGLPSRVLSSLLHLKSCLASCARCVSPYPELQNVAASLVSCTLSFGMAITLVQQALDNSGLLGTPESTDALRLIYRIGLLMEEVHASNASRVRLLAIEVLASTCQVGNRLVALECALWAVMDPVKTVRSAAHSNLTSLTGRTWRRDDFPPPISFIDGASGKDHACDSCESRERLLAASPNMYFHNVADVENALAQLSLLSVDCNFDLVGQGVEHEDECKRKYGEDRKANNLLEEELVGRGTDMQKELDPPDKARAVTFAHNHAAIGCHPVHNRCAYCEDVATALFDLCSPCRV